jgi:hypothetical protein
VAGAVLNRIGALAGLVPPASAVATDTAYVVEGCTFGSVPLVVPPIEVSTGAVDGLCGVAVILEDVRYAAVAGSGVHETFS